MDSLRILVDAPFPLTAPCSRCTAGNGNWDRIAGRTYCPDCQESLALNEGPPLLARTERRRCCVCGREGTVRYVTLPLRSTLPVELDVCPDHLRGLLGRRLPTGAFQQLRRRLHAAGLRAEQIFLLHEAFYDERGRALQPTADVE